jgi:hypothetical protein
MFIDFPPVNYPRLYYYAARHHERYARFVKQHGLTCQECGGSGQYVEDIIDFGGPECGSIPFEMFCDCGWCEGTGKVTRHTRGLWLRCKREGKRYRKAPGNGLVGPVGPWGST